MPGAERARDGHSAELYQSLSLELLQKLNARVDNPGPQSSVQQSDHEIDEAQNDLEAHKYPVAQAAFEKIRRRRWDDLSPSQRCRVQHGLAAILVAQGKDREAGRLYISAKDLNPDGERARIFEAVGYEMLGENEPANAFAAKFLEAYPNSAKLVACWIRTSPSSADPDELRKRVPPAAADDAEVCIALALNAMRRKDFDSAATFARKAMSVKDDWVGPHLLHGEACLQAAVAQAKMGYWVIRPKCDLEKLKESIASLNRAVEIVESQRVEHIKAEALVYRAFAKALLGDEASADEDFEEAVRLAPNEPGVLLRYAEHLHDQREYDKSVKVLRKLVKSSGAVEARQRLAALLVERDGQGDRKEATEIFRGLAVEAAGMPGPVLGMSSPEQIEHIYQGAFHAAADGLLAEKAHADLEQLLAGACAGRFSAVAVKTSWSKLKITSGVLEEAIRLADEAANHVTETTSRVDLKHLAAHLMKLGRHKEALPLWELVNVPGEYSEDVRQLIRCAEQLDRQEVILRTCRTLRECGIDDSWLLHRELDVLEPSDVEQAIFVLKRHLQGRTDDHLSRLRLTRIGFDYDRPELVDCRPEVIPGVEEVSSASGAMAVEVMQRCGRATEAVSYAYELYRRFTDDPVANMALVKALFAIGAPGPKVPEFESVGPGAAVCYAEEGWPDAWLIVEDSPEPNRTLGEYPPDNPLARELAGKRVGDAFLLAESSARDRTATVKEVVSKYVYRANEITKNWQVRFRDFPWVELHQTMLLNPVTGEHVRDFSAMQLVADKQFDRAKKAEEQYKSGQVTIHIFAHNSGRKDFDTSIYAALRNDLEIRCWSGSRLEMDQAIEAINPQTELVLDITALATHALLREEKLIEQWPGKLIISQNTANQLRDCLKDIVCDKQAAGHFGKTERGYHFVDRDDEYQREQRRLLGEYLTLVFGRCEVHGCPELVTLDPEKRRTLSTVFGQHGLESVLLGSRPGRVLWTDEAMLAGLARSEFGTFCAWTQAVVECGVYRGFFDSTYSHTVAAKLLGFNYRSTVFNETTLCRSASLAGWDPHRTPFAQALEQLSDEKMGVGDSGRLAITLMVNLFRQVFLEEKRQAVLIAIAEQLSRQKFGVTLVEALTNVFPRCFGLNVLHLREATDVLRAWSAESRRRLDLSGCGLIALPGKRKDVRKKGRGRP